MPGLTPNLHEPSQGVYGPVASVQVVPGRCGRDSIYFKTVSSSYLRVAGKTCLRRMK